jgi:multiple sugar transport system permease protein
VNWRRLQRHARGSALTLLTWCIVLTSLLPLVWLFGTAIKPRLDAFAYPPVWSFEPTLDNFRAVLARGNFVRSYVNSIVVALGTTAVSLVLGIASGYAIARSRSRVSAAMGTWILLARMAPPMGFVLPLFLLFRYLGLLGTHFALIVVYLTVTLPFVTWLMVGFVNRVPVEIEEAARIDGASRLQTLLLVVVPATLPGIAASSIFAFIMSWNEFFYALIISGRQSRTAPVEIQGFISFTGINWGELAAAGVFVIVPVLVFSLFTQRGLIKGLTAGAVRG